MLIKTAYLDLPPKRCFRILMSADTVGGVWNYAVELTRALAPYGCEVVLGTMGALPSAAQRATAAKLSNLTLCASDFRLEWMDEPWRDVECAGRWLLDLEASCAPDVIHLNGYVHAAMPWRAPTLIVGHSCVDAWFAAVHGTVPGAPWDEYRRRVGVGLRTADLVTAPSRAMLRELQRFYGPFAAAAPIYNGRRAGDFPPADKEPLIFAAGRVWDEAKNLRALEAIALHLDWPIYIAGENRAPGATVPVGIGGGIQQLGELASREFSDWLGRAAIFVHPARYEPFGLAVLEAALAGCALVLGDIASLREIWRDTALYVPANDPAAIRAALEHLIESPVRRRALANAARQRALQFSPARMALDYMEVYCTLVSERKKQLPA